MISLNIRDSSSKGSGQHRSLSYKKKKKRFGIFHWAACELLGSDINGAKIVLSKLHAARRVLLCVGGRSTCGQPDNGLTRYTVYRETKPSWWREICIQ